MKEKQAIFTALNGKVKFLRGGYNITSDAVWLAAIVASSGKGKTILDAGIGTGGVALCLLEHNPNLRITGLDISESMLAECAKNAALNGRELELIHADILDWRTSRTFDVVMTNPPYFRGTPKLIKQGVASHPARGGSAPKGGEGGPHHNANLYEWTRKCLKRVRPRGSFFTIVDSAATAEIIAALYAGKAGGIEIRPLFGAKSVAERVLISARLGVKTGTKISEAARMSDYNLTFNK
jgi:tRNA1(Val) A37 N6-methylase TrmN6